MAELGPDVVVSSAGRRRGERAELGAEENGRSLAGAEENGRNSHSRQEHRRVVSERKTCHSPSYQPGLLKWLAHGRGFNKDRDSLSSRAAVTDGNRSIVALWVPNSEFLM
jgi:hypothetical protein